MTSANNTSSLLTIVTVDFATANGTTNPATGGAACGAGVDYVNGSGTVAFSATYISKPISVTVCGDSVYEANETFVVNLTNATEASIAGSQALGTIMNDDAEVAYRCVNPLLHQTS